MRLFPALLLAASLGLAPVALYAVPASEQEEVQEPESIDISPDAAAPDPAPAPTTAGQPQTTEQQPTAGTQPPANSANTPPNAVGEKLPAENGDTNFTTVVLRGINKVTAKTQPIEAPIGSVTRFGTIEIVAHKCWKSAPEDRPENAALLEISEIKQGEAPQRVFSGWMFSSTPGISSLEHPFYDINVVGCGKKSATQ